MQTDYQQEVGVRLRAVRQLQHLTLAEVEEKSGGRWKAVVVGSYERGDRAVTVPRLRELAAFYGIPVGHLLPDDAASPQPDQGLPTIDLRALEERADDYAPLMRFVRRIQQERGDYNGRVITLRMEDLRSVAAAAGDDPERLVDRLRREHLLTE